jgi:hypothetical protein
MYIPEEKQGNRKEKEYPMTRQSRWLTTLLVALVALVGFSAAPSPTQATPNSPTLRTAAQQSRSASATGGVTIQSYVRQTCNNATQRDQPGGRTIDYIPAGSFVLYHYNDGAWSYVTYNYRGWILNTALC